MQRIAIMPTRSLAALSRQPWYPRYVLGLLILVYAINIMDRQVLALLLEDIRHDFALNDAQLGLLGGLAFAVFYAVLGIPLARLADGGRRREVLAGCLLLWSLATACCGLAVGFVSLLIARIGTAIGEAGGSPASHALIASHFPPAQRATALSFYALGVPLGALVGNLASGWLNELLPWRWVFIVLGLPGLPCALLVWNTLGNHGAGASSALAVAGVMGDDGGETSPVCPTSGVTDAAMAVREQGRAIPSVSLASSVMPFAQAAVRLLRRRSYRHLCLAAALHSVVWYAGSTWNASFFMRLHGLGPGPTGTLIAALALMGLVGTCLGGRLADRLAARYDDARWYWWVPGLAILSMLPLQCGAYLGTYLGIGLAPALGCFAAMTLLAATFFGPSYAVAQALAEEHSRALAAALLLFTQTLIGLGIGPWITGVLSDWLAPRLGDASLGHALALVGIVNLWSAWHYRLGAQVYRQDLQHHALACVRREVQA